MELGPVAAAMPTPTKASGPRAANTNSLTLFGAVGPFSVAPGGVFKITSSSNYDYTGADTLAVAIECPSGNNLQNVGITVWWGNSIAANLTLTDVIHGSSFNLPSMGGGKVPRVRLATSASGRQYRDDDRLL